MACKACNKSHLEVPCKNRRIALSKRMRAGVEYDSDRSSVGGYGEASAADFAREVAKLEKQLAAAAQPAKEPQP